MTGRKVLVLVGGALVLASAVAAWKHSSRSEGSTTSAARRAHPTTISPSARRVASVFVRSVVRGKLAAARRVVDRTYPCGMSGPPGQRGKIWFLPLAKGFTTRGISFDAPFMVGDSLVVEVRVRTRTNVPVSFQMEL